MSVVRHVEQPRSSSMADNVCFIDTETLGLDADVHPVWEVGLILPDGTEECWQIEVTPRELSLAHPKALEVGRFDERYKAEHAWKPVAIAAELWDLIPPGAHLAGAVVSFDEERLRRLLWRFGYAPPWHYHLCDCEALVAGKLGVPPPWDSHELSSAVGVDPADFDRHTALGDARWAKALFDAVMGDGR